MRSVLFKFCIYTSCVCNVYIIFHTYDFVGIVRRSAGLAPPPMRNHGHKISLSVSSESRGLPSHLSPIRICRSPGGSPREKVQHHLRQIQIQIGTVFGWFFFCIFLVCVFVAAFQRHNTIILMVFMLSIELLLSLLFLSRWGLSHWLRFRLFVRIWVWGSVRELCTDVMLGFCAYFSGCLNIRYKSYVQFFENYDMFNIHCQ